MKLDFWNNPLVVSSFRVKYRRSGMFNITMLYILVLVAAGMLLNYYNDRFSGPWPRDYLLAILGIQFSVSGLMAASATGVSMKAEVTNRTLDFQRLTSLSPARILLGKLLGEPALAFLLAMASIPMAVWCCFLGVEGVPIWVLVLLYVNVATTTILLGALGLIQPLEPPAGKQTGNAGGGAGWGIAAFIFIPQLIMNSRSLLSSSWSSAAVGLLTPVPLFVGIYNGDVWHESLSFFGLNIPFLLVTPLSQLLLTWLCFSAMTRRLINPIDTSISKRTGYLLLFVVDLLGGAVLFDPLDLGLSFTHRSAVFCLVHVVGTFLVAGSATPIRTTLLSWIWRYRGHTPWLRDWTLGERSPNTAALILFSILGLLSLGLFVILPAWLHDSAEVVDSLDQILAQAGVMVVLIMAVGTMLQWFVFLFGRTGFWISITVVLLLSLPLHLAGESLKIEFYLSLAPSAHFARWFSDRADLRVEPILLLYACLFAAFFFSLRRRLAQKTRGVNKKLASMGVVPPAGPMIATSLVT